MFHHAQSPLCGCLHFLLQLPRLRFIASGPLACNTPVKNPTTKSTNPTIGAVEGTVSLTCNLRLVSEVSRGRYPGGPVSIMYAYVNSLHHVHKADFLRSRGKLHGRGSFFQCVQSEACAWAGTPGDPKPWSKRRDRDCGTGLSGYFPEDVSAVPLPHPRA